MRRYSSSGERTTALVSTEQILAAAITHPDVAFRLKNALVSDLVVANPFQRQVAEFLSDFLDTYGTLPKEGDWTAWISGLPERQKQGVKDALRKIRRKRVDDMTPEFLAEHAIPELRNAAARTALARLNELDEVDSDAIQHLAERVRAVEPAHLEGLIHLRDYEHVLRHTAATSPGIMSGLHSVDQYTGGFQEELVFVLADSGVGKTTTLINFAAAAALRGARVFHLTLELSAQNSALRYYRRVAEATRGEIRSGSGEVRDRVGHWWKMAKGEIAVLFRPAYTLTPEELHDSLRLFSRQYGELDLIVVDYLDLLSSSPAMRGKSSYDQLGYTSHYLRGFCSDFGATVLSATQATRPKSKKDIEHLSLARMGDSYKKVRAADIILGLIQTKEEEEQFQGRICLLKVRESAGRGTELPVYVNMDLMMIADLDHPNTRRIMEELGQL